MAAYKLSLEDEKAMAELRETLKNSPPLSPEKAAALEAAANKITAAMCKNLDSNVENRTPITQEVITNRNSVVEALGREMCENIKASKPGLTAKEQENYRQSIKNPLQISQLEKGMRLKLRSGWEAVVVKKCDGNILTAEVFGGFTETGSIYAHDVVAALVDGQWVQVGLDEEQTLFSEEISSFVSIPEIKENKEGKEMIATLPMDPMILKALDLATKAHTGQLRKGTNIPYVTHPSAVGLILSQYGCSAAVISAGILHDTVEDGDVTLEEIAIKFSPEVAALVKGCSEPDKKAGWITRKQHTIEYLRSAPKEIKLVSAADKLHNIKSMLTDYQEHGEGLWKRFKRGREDQEWYYRGVVEALGSNGFDEHPLHDELFEAVNTMFCKVKEKEKPTSSGRRDKMSEIARRLGEEMCANIRAQDPNR